MINGVHFVGASGTGKTTLANYVEKKYGLQKLPSAARTVLKEWGLKETEFAQLMKDQEGYFRYQYRVLCKQIELEDAVSKFVADRAFDHAAFSVLYGRYANRLIKTPLMADYFQSLKTGRILFLVKPTKECLEKALADGDRKEYLVWEDMHRFDGMLRYIFEIESIPYRQIDMVDLDERCDLIDRVLQSNGVLPV